MSNQNRQLVAKLRHLCDAPEDCQHDQCWSWTLLDIETGEVAMGDTDSHEMALTRLRTISDNQWLFT